MLELRRYEDHLAESWDEFCQNSINATLLHTRRFLSYHGERFRDRSLLITRDGEIVGVFPAAEAYDDPSVVVSHPGATYGGLVHDGWLTGQRMIDAFELIVGHLKLSGYRVLRYKPIPFIYATCPADDDLYALFRKHGQRVRTDLSSTIDLIDRRTPSQRRRRALRKARTNVVVHVGMEWLDDFYKVLQENLAGRHGATPVHSLDELQMLASRFPSETSLTVAASTERVVAGVFFFRSPRVAHAQYIASTTEGFELSALDAIFEDAISAATDEGFRFFDFGISNEQDGLVLNEGLYRFKTEFGGGGVVYEQYEIDCQ